VENKIGGKPPNSFWKEFKEMRKNTKKPKKIINLSSEETTDNSSDNNDSNNKNNNNNNNNKEEGMNMDNKKVDSGFQFNIDEETMYNWIVFSLDAIHYMGFESQTELQAIVISKEFYEAFKTEFESS
jgi:hypothetical protein